jgi:carbonic anhydrase
LMSYPVVRDRVAGGTLRLSGWWFNIATGDMFAYQRETRAFTAIDRQTAERLIVSLVSDET